MLKKVFKNKKGSLQDLILIMVILIIFAMATLYSFKITSEFDDKIQSMDIFDAQGKAASTSIVNNFSGSVDNSFLLLVMGLAMVVLVTATLVKVHPIFIPFFIIGLIIIIFISGIASNIYQQTAEHELMSGVASEMVFTTTILNILPWFVAVFGTLLMIVMHRVWKIEQDE